MQCHEAEGLLAPQISESLDAATQSELALHLESCAACRARLQQEYELDRLVAAAVAQATPPCAPLMQRIEQGLQENPARSWSLRQWQWPAFAGAAAVVLLCALALTRLYSHNPMHMLCLDAVDDHRTEVVLREPRHWHSNANEIAELAHSTVPAAQIPQNLAGFTLEKARICGLLQATALHLVYRNGSQQVSVFLMLRRDLPSDSLPALAGGDTLHQENDSGMAVASFAGDGLGAVVVGNPGATRDLATQLARSL